MSTDQLRREPYDSFKNRAMLYYLLYDELRKELGAERAEAIMVRAVYRRGAEKGREKYARFGPGDLGRHEASLDAEYVGQIPSDSGLFQLFAQHLADGPSDFAPI